MRRLRNSGSRANAGCRCWLSNHRHQMRRPLIQGLAFLVRDPCSAWTAKANKRVQFGYGLNYLVDTENAVIVDVEPTPARTYDEVESTKTMLERTERRLNLKPKRLAADTAYGTGRFLGWLVARGIAPHIPVRDASPPPHHRSLRRDHPQNQRNHCSATFSS